MDTNGKDESRDRRRQEALARRLGEALDRSTPRGTEPCPEAECIAAYHERALSPEEATQCETHFAACSRCRKILAVLAASDDTPLAEKEVARLGELVAAGAQVPREATPQTFQRLPNRWDWRAHWLAPALGVAAVLAMWFAIRPPWRAVQPNSSGTLVAQAPKDEPPPNEELRVMDQPPKVSPRKSPGVDGANVTVTPKDRPATNGQPPKPLAESFANNHSGYGNAIEVPAPAAPQNEKKEQTDLKAAPMATPTPALPPAAVPSPPAVARAQAHIAGQTSSGAATDGSAGQAVTVTGEAPAVNAAGGAFGGTVSKQKAGQLPLSGRSYQDLIDLNAAGNGAVLIQTPTTSKLWRVGKGGSIERSSDTGQTWRVQASPLQVDWLAGAAVSDKICWLVGRNGAIARTVNGARWERITPPVQAAADGKSPDWIGVTARDAMNATVTAGDGSRFATQDGGKTWQPQ